MLFYIKYGCSVSHESLIVDADDFDAADRYAEQAAQDCYYSYDCNYLSDEDYDCYEEDGLGEKVALKDAVKREPDLADAEYDLEKVVTVSPVLRALYGEGQPATVKFLSNKEILNYDPATASLSPDHIVYCKAKQLIIPADADGDKIKELFDAFVAENGYKPKVAFMAGLGMFTCGTTIKEAVTAQTVMLDAIKVVAYAESFGGVSPMPQFLIDFIVNWEVESYRSKVKL